MIQNPAKLSLQRTQLKLSSDAGEFTLPLEDITALVLESPQITLSSSLLAACQENGIAVLTCDASHMPNGVLLPYLPHSRHSKVARIQLSWSEPLRKRLWQRVIQAKIANQAACLNRWGREGATRLRALAERVGSGDPDNIEAQAAREYWQKLLGSDFRRGASDLSNAALNYGYAVIRAYVARAQVAAGLLPAFGIHHESELNAFNLTDDVMECLRPMVDDCVMRLQIDGLLPTDEAFLPASARQQLAALGALHCTLSDEKHTLITVCERLATGLVAAIEGKTPTLLPLPTFCDHEADDDDA